MNIRNKTKILDINQIKPYANNAKKHPDWQIEKIKESIQKYDYLQPIVVDMSGCIVMGHGRYEALKLMGEKSVEVVQVDIAENEAKKLRILDNKIISSEWDNEILQAEIEEIYGDNKDIEKMISEVGVNYDEIKMPDFEPVGIEEQGRLDQKEPTVCPECGHSWQK